MTDEEIAEKYINSNNLEWELECHRTSTIGEVKQAFLAGLKAGRPKWHKVADGDLPKEEGEYLICYENGVGYRNTFILNYTEYDESLHWCDDAFETYDEGIIAWCEIPKYTEE